MLNHNHNQKASGAAEATPNESTPNERKPTDAEWFAGARRTRDWSEQAEIEAAEKQGEAIIIDTPAGIEGVALCALKGALKLEILGLKRRGQSAYAIAKARFGFKGSRQAVLRQLEKHIAEFNVRHGFTAAK